MNESSENAPKNPNRLKEILCNINKVTILSKEGGQPFLEILANQLMLLTMEEDHEMNGEQMDFLCSFLHKSLYKSLIPEIFFDYDEGLQPEYLTYQTKKLRFDLFDNLEKQEWTGKSEALVKIVEEKEKVREKGENQGFCRVF